MNAYLQSNDISPIASPALIVTSGASALINIVFIVVCYKTFKKTFHNLVILSLCINDLVLNMSLICVGITALSEFWKKQRRTMSVPSVFGLLGDCCNIQSCLHHML
jgi:hypothetical protein